MTLLVNEVYGRKFVAAVVALAERLSISVKCSAEVATNAYD